MNADGASCFEYMSSQPKNIGSAFARKRATIGCRDLRNAVSTTRDKKRRKIFGSLTMKTKTRSRKKCGQHNEGGPGKTWGGTNPLGHARPDESRNTAA